MVIALVIWFSSLFFGNEKYTREKKIHYESIENMCALKK